MRSLTGIKQLQFQKVYMGMLYFLSYSLVLVLYYLSQTKDAKTAIELYALIINLIEHMFFCVQHVNLIIHIH